MVRDVSRLHAQRFDLLVIGGGICGLASAYDAAQRGLKVALIERDDFGGATTFNHARTIHGGLRSLQTGDLGKAHASMVERRALATIAPHLVEPQAFLMGTYAGLTRGRLALGAGFALDALVGWRRNDGLPSFLQLPAGRLVSRKECLDRFPGVREPGLTGGALWYDYLMPEADRLTFAFARAAASHGAVIANYVEATSLKRTGPSIRGAEAIDRLDGRSLDIESHVTLIAAGPWSAGLVAPAGASRDIPLLKAMNLVTTRPMGPTALAAPTHDGRMLLMIPWKGRALIGTAHSRQRVGIHDTGAGEGEIDDFIGEINQAFPSLNLARAEVSLVHRGIVPAIERGQGSLALRPDPMLRDHRSDGIEGAVSLVGVKYTTGRGAAQKAIDIVCAKLGRVVKSRTATTKLPCAEGFDRETALRQCLTSGIVSDDTDAARHLTQAYGSAYAEVLALAAARPELGRRIDRRSPVIRAALVHAVRAEMACTLSDAVLRRTALGTMQYPGDDALKVAAEIVGGELGWNDARAEQERQAVLRFYQPEA